jgi:hypothetical protein
VNIGHYSWADFTDEETLVRPVELCAPLDCNGLKMYKFARQQAKTITIAVKGFEFRIDFQPRLKLIVVGFGSVRRQFVMQLLHINDFMFGMS